MSKFKIVAEKRNLENIGISYDICVKKFIYNILKTISV